MLPPFRSSSGAEQAAVNRRVGRSKPSSGATSQGRNAWLLGDEQARSPEGLCLVTKSWHVEPLEVEHVHSSRGQDRSVLVDTIDHRSGSSQAAPSASRAACV